MLVKRYSVPTLSWTDTVANEQLTVWRRRGAGILTVVHEGRSASPVSGHDPEELSVRFWIHPALTEVVDDALRTIAPTAS